MRLATTRVLLLAGTLAALERPVVAQTRDPFVSPFRRNDPQAETARPRGLAGIAVEELILLGLVRVDGAYFAVLESSNSRSYLVRGGERLFDGAVRSVTAGGVVIVRDRGRGERAGERTVQLTLRPPHEEP